MKTQLTFVAGLARGHSIARTEKVLPFFPNLDSVAKNWNGSLR